MSRKNETPVENTSVVDIEMVNDHVPTTDEVIDVTNVVGVSKVADPPKRTPYVPVPESRVQSKVVTSDDEQAAYRSGAVMPAFYAEVNGDTPSA